jgi:transcriptional regulator NrdR family protein
VKCGHCNAEIKGKTVLYTVTVATAQGEYIRRRRNCPRCGGRWWTYEVPESDWHVLEAFRAQLEAATISRAARAPEPEPARPKYRF